MDDIFKKLEEDELYKNALASVKTDEERAKIKAHAHKMLSSFLKITEQIKNEQQLDE